MTNKQYAEGVIAWILGLMLYVGFLILINAVADRFYD